MPVTDGSLARNKGGRPHIPVTEEQARALRMLGKSLREIGRELKISKTSVSRLLDARPSVSQNPIDVSLNFTTDPTRTFPPAAVIIRPPRRKPGISAQARPVPVNGRSPGPCPQCASNIWRLMADGTVVCTLCNPLNAL
jgi:hypothetical protein